MATHARIFYYYQRVGVNIDFASYNQWLSKHPNHKVPSILPEGYSQTESGSQAQDPDSLSWQASAPKAELYVPRSAQQEASGSAPQAGGGGQPNYPMGFAEMLKLIQEGKDVPGIKQIPNTLARDPVSLLLCVQTCASLFLTERL